MGLSEYEKDQLKKMIQANDTKDMTDKIRDNKHSIKIKYILPRLSTIPILQEPSYMIFHLGFP